MPCGQDKGGRRASAADSHRGSAHHVAWAFGTGDVFARLERGVVEHLRARSTSTTVVERLDGRAAAVVRNLERGPVVARLESRAGVVHELRGCAFITELQGVILELDRRPVVGDLDRR